ncbi:Ccc1 family [Xylariaceae sp. AK1471]|nr:Ccc1 family [Xylariaceae sp. AK1471]
MELLDRLSGWSERRRAGPHQTLPAYSTLPTTPNTVTDASSVEDSRANDDCSDASVVRPPLSRFLADFTLGFADGLTVPFALTASLSSLGQTNTVIYAGMAEICAGCISMGIGGYLAAKGEERRETANEDNRGDDNHEKSTSSISVHQNREVDNYLTPLRLPPDLLHSVMAHIESSPDIAELVGEYLDLARNEPTPKLVKTSPVMSGLSVALGYLLGGLLPLAPYFFVSNVTNGLLWSFGICIIALFIFGFTKECVLLLKSTSQAWNSRTTRIRLLQWDLIRHGLWEGIRMVMFGGIAAVAAVLCVRLFDGLVS